MELHLFIALGVHWKVGSLEAVETVADLSLSQDPAIPGLFTIGSEFQMKLSDGTCSDIWCARTPQNRYILQIKVNGQLIARIEANEPPSSQIRMPEGSIYIFNVRSRS